MCCVLVKQVMDQLHFGETVNASVASCQMVDGSFVVSGYDSDIAWEKGVDYVAKIYSASTRNMSGTKPHLQHRELPVEER